MPSSASSASGRFDRGDAGLETVGNGWWWELPLPYADSSDLNERSEIITGDINSWIADSGFWVFGNTGTKDGLEWRVHEDALGHSNYDFILNELVHFLYVLRDRPDLLDDSNVTALDHQALA